MNWSSISKKSNLGKLLRLPLQFVPKNIAVPVVQGPLKGMKWITGSSTNGCWLGSFEYDKQIAFAKIITKGSIVYDLGAHVGFYTLLSSKLVGPKGRVIAFEPLPRNIALLNKHLDINHLTNVTIIEAAVSDKSGFTIFKEGLNHTMGHIDIGNGTLQIKVVSIDELIVSKSLPSPDYLKIDIEGNELLALKGAYWVIQQKHPTIFLATHGKQLHTECCALLSSWGYRLNPLIGSFGNTIETTDEFVAVFP
jgi:FkbM family methyltransferase